MKTIKTRNIDGYEVVESVNAAEGFIDTESTKKIVAVELAKSKTYIEIERLKSQIQTLVVQAKQSQRSAQRATTAEERTQYWNEYKRRGDEIKAIETQLLPLAAAIKNEYADLVLKHAIYFPIPPRDGVVEEYVEDSEGEVIAAARGEAKDAVIAIDRSKGGRDILEVADYRGRRYWHKQDGKWTGTEISTLGIAPVAAAIAEADLSADDRAEIAEQVESERIAKLKPAEIESERAARLDSLAAEAQMMRGKIEIAGGKDALKTAQEWYATEAAKVVEKYE